MGAEIARTNGERKGCFGDAIMHRHLSEQAKAIAAIGGGVDDIGAGVRGRALIGSADDEKLGKNTS
jgi:hypothetical protein